MRSAILTVCFLALASTTLLAVEDELGAPPAPESPELPPPVQSGEELEPDVTIIRRGDKLIQEYRVNGQLYMVKIVPDAGPPYYLVDPDGDGNLDVRRSDMERSLNIPQWVILKW